MTIAVVSLIILILVVNQPDEFSLHWCGWLFAAVMFLLGELKKINIGKSR